MNNYEKTCNEISEKISKANQAKGRVSSAVSKSDMDVIAQSLLNTPEHVVRSYTFSLKADSNEEPTYVEKAPVQRYRNALKKTVKEMGVDKNDLDVLDTMEFTKEHAASVMDVATTAMHDYMKAGRKFAFPITSLDETKMEMTCVDSPEKISVNRFSKDETDNLTVIKERKTLKAKNPVPHWLKAPK